MIISGKDIENSINLLPQNTYSETAQMRFISSIGGSTEVSPNR